MDTEAATTREAGPFYFSRNKIAQREAPLDALRYRGGGPYSVARFCR
jgi:hypothetical protein